MNKEILEITKKFHDTYEKLASEYTYETREDTKVFDINSNNGKLMYATVNEIVSPILKENKQLKEKINGIYDERNYLYNKLSVENEQLQQQNKKYKEVIDKAIEYIEYNNEDLYVYNPDYDYEENIVSNYDATTFREDLLDILKEADKEVK